VRSQSARINEATIDKATLTEFKQSWAEPTNRLQMIPGKDAVSDLNSRLQERYGVSVTPTAIIDAMTVAEIRGEVRQLVQGIAQFALLKPE
jgi:hypothetical protein